MNEKETEAHPDDLEDVARRSRLHRRWFRRQQPKTVANVLAEVIQKRGYAQVQEGRAWDEAWRAAVGERFAEHTQVGAIKRGSLEIVVANSLLMQELGFEKERLLAELQRSLPDKGIKQIRFRVGKVP